MTSARPHRLLMIALIFAGWMVGAAATFGIYALNDARDEQLRHVQAVEAWARYDGQIESCARGNSLRILINAQLDADLPIVRCYQTVHSPTLPRPKE